MSMNTQYRGDTFHRFNADKQKINKYISKQNIQTNKKQKIGKCIQSSGCFLESISFLHTVGSPVHLWGGSFSQGCVDKF